MWPCCCWIRLGPLPTKCITPETSGQRDILPGIAVQITPWIVVEEVLWAWASTVRGALMDWWTSIDWSPIDAELRLRWGSYRRWSTSHALRKWRQDSSDEHTVRSVGHVRFTRETTKTEAVLLLLLLSSLLLLLSSPLLLLPSFVLCHCCKVIIESLCCCHLLLLLDCCTELLYFMGTGDSEKQVALVSCTR